MSGTRGCASRDAGLIGRRDCRPAIHLFGTARADTSARSFATFGDSRRASDGAQPACYGSNSRAGELLNSLIVRGECAFHRRCQASLTICYFVYATIVTDLMFNSVFCRRGCLTVDTAKRKLESSPAALFRSPNAVLPALPHVLARSSIICADPKKTLRDRLRPPLMALRRPPRNGRGPTPPSKSAFA